jgi:hypothetical protein
MLYCRNGSGIRSSSFAADDQTKVQTTPDTKPQRVSQTAQLVRPSPGHLKTEVHLSTGVDCHNELTFRYFPPGNGGSLNFSHPLVGDSSGVNWRGGSAGFTGDFSSHQESISQCVWSGPDVSYHSLVFTATGGFIVGRAWEQSSGPGGVKSI